MDARALSGTDLEHFGLAAPLHGIQTVFGKLTKDSLNVAFSGLGLVNLVERHHDRHASCLGMVDALNGLRHDAVIGSHHQHHNVRHACAASAHLRERFVAGRIDESHHALLVARLDGDLECTGRLGDATRFARCNIGVTNAVKQAGLTVVDVTKDGDHRRTRALFRANASSESLLDDVGNALRLFHDELNFIAHHDFNGALGFDAAVDGGHLAGQNELLQNVAGLHAALL